MMATNKNKRKILQLMIEDLSGKNLSFTVAQFQKEDEKYIENENEIEELENCRL